MNAVNSGKNPSFPALTIQECTPRTCLWNSAWLYTIFPLKASPAQGVCPPLSGRSASWLTGRRTMSTGPPQWFVVFPLIFSLYTNKNACMCNSRTVHHFWFLGTTLPQDLRSPSHKHVQKKAQQRLQFGQKTSVHSSCCSICQSVRCIYIFASTRQERLKMH